MKKLLILGLCITLASCGTTGIQGDPSAVMLGASIGGSLGSIIGGTSNDYNGWAIGNIIGTVAGAAIGTAMTIPQNNTQTTNDGTYNAGNYGTGTNNGTYNDYPQPNNGNATNNSNCQNDDNTKMTNTIPLTIEDIRFVDENNDHIIAAREVCKLIFNLKNTGNTILYNVYPRIVLSNRKVGASAPLIIDKMEPGEVKRYTASIYGYSDLQDGEVTFTLSACQQNGGVGTVRQFTLQTKR